MQMVLELTTLEGSTWMQLGEKNLCFDFVGTIKGGAMATNTTI